MTPFKAMCRRAPRGGLIVPVLALLSMTVAANADSPTSAIQISDVHLVQRDAVGARNDCWADAPMDAIVFCASPEPEHSSLTAEITLENEAATDIVVAYESMDLTATGGTDYVALDGTVTIATGEDSATFAIDFTDDLVEEGNETFVVKLTPPEGVDLEQDYIHVTIIDEESIKITVADSSQGEGNRRGMFVDVDFSESVSWSFSFGVGTTAGTAGPDDYVDSDDSISNMFTVPTGQSATGFTFRHFLRDDSLDEPDETYTLFIEGHQYLSMDRGSATMTIRDNDDPPSVSIADASGLEDSVGTLSFDVTLNAESGKEITLDYATADDTATMGSDYDHTAGNLTFAPGEVEKRVEVAVKPDDVHEPDETFKVTLQDLDEVTAGDTAAFGTIQNDDAQLSIADAAASESDGKLEFLVKADGLVKTNQTVTVTYETADGTATAGSDYTSNSGTLIFTSTDTEETITVTVIDDTVDEPDETLGVNLIFALNASLGDASAEGTIRDNDETSSEITLTASPARVSENGGAKDIVVTATLDGGARTEATEVAVSVAGSGDADAVDFQSVSSFTITIDEGDTSGTGTFTLTPIDDELDESDETLSVTGTSVLTVNGTEVELTDDDATSSSIALTAQPPRVSEGDGATDIAVTATLDAGARTEETTVTVSVSGSGNADAVDFAEVRDFIVTITAGERSGTGSFTLTPEDDNVDETDETLNVDGSSDLPVTADTVALADDDNPSAAILLSANPARIPEDGGAAPIQVTATLDASARAVATTVSVSVAGRGRPNAVDYAATPTSFDITIAAGATTGTETFTVTPEDDEVDERNEVLDIAGTSDLPVTPTLVRLLDDDQASTEILLSASPSTVSEGAGATSVEVTATLDAGARTEETTVAVTVMGSGDPDAVDFIAVPDFTITIAGGVTSGRGTFNVTPEDDNLEESGETLTVDGTADLPVTGTAVTITDDDVASDGIVLSASPARVSEEGGAVPVRVTASLNGAARQTGTTVTVSVAGSGNPDAVDFQPVQDFTITISPNAANGEGAFTLVPLDDGTAEADETLTLSGVSDVSALPVTPTTVRLADDDDPSTQILLSAVPERVSEGDGPTRVRVTATLDRASRQQATSVSVSVSGSGDPGAVDFSAVPDFSITIPANAASGEGTFTLTPQDDATVESDETLTVSGASDLPVTPTAMTLVDNDEESTRILLFLTVDPPRASEGDGEIRVTVTASVDRGVRPDDTRIGVSVSGSGDPDAVDFDPIPDFDLVIPANTPNGKATFTVVPEDDLIVEADETLTVSGVSDLPVTPAAMELLDDDEASGRIVLSADPARVSEGDGPVAVTVTASLDRGLRRDATTVAVSVSGSGDPDAVDFDPIPDFDLVIPANTPNGTATFTVVPEDDLIVEADETLTVSGVSDLPVTPAAMELLDDDEASGRIVLSADPPRVSEGDGPVAVTVTASLDRGLRRDATTVAVSVSGSGDPDAVDFDPIPDFDLVIPANTPNGTATFTVVPEDDLIVEADETLTVSGVSDLPVTPAAMELLDDDEASGRIVLSADPARVSEGDGPVAVTVTASLDRGLRQEATSVTVSVSGSGNPDAVDFAAVADFKVVILASAPSGTGTFTLTPEDDAEDEADETLALTGESGLPVTPASVVLADDDEMASRVLSITDAEAAESAGDMAFAVTLDGPSAAEVTVGYATADPAESSYPVAEAGIDYESAAGMLTFAPGEVSQTIRVQVLDDELDEPDETFALVLSDLRGATLSRGSALGTIRDDDEPPALSIAGDTGREDVGELVFSVTLSAPSLTAVTVDYASTDGTAGAGMDYGMVEGTLALAPGKTAKTIRVLVIDDALDEADEETFAVALSAPTGATLDAGTATGTIRDDDDPPALSVADAAGDEDVGALEFQVTLSAPSGIEVSAPYATKDGTAAAGSDYAAATGTLVFAPGEVSQTIRVAILDDALDEADEETFELTLARLVNATPADVSATGTIRDNDLAPPPSRTTCRRRCSASGERRTNLTWRITSPARNCGSPRSRRRRGWQRPRSTGAC